MAKTKSKKGNKANIISKVQKAGYFVVKRKAPSLVTVSRNAAGNIKIKRKKRTKRIRNALMTTGDSRGALQNMAYLKCRINPFGSHGIVDGHPDGSETRRILVDHRSINTITFGSTGTMQIMVVPCLPSPLWLNTAGVDNTWKINGATMVNSWPSFSYPICLPEWASSVINNKNTEENYNEVSTLYGASEFRIVSVGWAITFIGNATNQAGAIIATSGRISASSAVPNMGDFVCHGALAGSTTYAIGQVLTRPINYMPQFGAYGNDTVQTSLYQGAHGTLKHSTKNFEYQPLSENLTYLTYTGDSRFSQLVNYDDVPTLLGRSGAVLGMDSDWNCTLLNVTGGTAGSSFLLDLVFCVEYAPNPSSSVYPLSKAAPPEDTKIMAMAQRAVRDKPIMTSGGSTSLGNVADAVMSATSAISTIGKIGSAVGALA